MTGDNKLKHIAFFLIFLMLFISYGHILFAIDLPGSEEVKSARQNIGEKVSSIFQKIKNIGIETNGFISFFKNTSQKIGSWWYSSPKPWIESLWNSFNDYIKKEIKLE